eukprot:jgi/Chrzof1/5881/Cz16g19070.t1
MASTRASQPTTDRFYPYGLKCLSPGSTLETTLQRLGSQFQEVSIQESAFVKPASVLYELDGRQRRWDIIKSHDSVGVVLYHTQLDAFIIVRQFRPAVYATKLRQAQAMQQPAPPLAEGFTFELCAGLVDKAAKSLEQIVAEEVYEECGYSINAADVSRVTNSVSSSGTSGSDHTIFYAQVSDTARATEGGGELATGEAIEVLALPFDQVPKFIMDGAYPKSPGLQFGLLWAYHGLLQGDLKGRPGSKLQTAPLTLQPVLPS